MLDRRYYLLLAAFFCSSIGDWLYRIALPILIFQLTGSAFSMSLVYALTFLPFILVTPAGGVIADRLNRKGILIYGDLLAGILSVGLAVVSILCVRGVVPTSVIYPLVFLVAAVASIYHPAFQSLIPQLVIPSRLAKANSYISGADNLIYVVGPLVSGMVIVAFGAINAIILNAATFFVSAALIALIRVETPIAAVGRRLRWSTITDDIKMGARYAWKTPVVKYGSLLFLFTNFGTGLVQANFMYLLVNLLKIGARDVGITIAITGTGALIGSLMAPYVLRHSSEGKTIAGCTALAGLATLLLIVAHSHVAAGAVWGLVCACNSIIIVTYFTLRQRAVPGEYLGRAVAITRLVSYATIPVAAVLGGWILQNTNSFKPLVLVSAIIVLSGGVMAWRSPLNSIPFERADAERTLVNG